MRRVLLTAASLAALTLTAPAVALANHRHHHHHKSPSHHATVSFRHIGPVTAGPVAPPTAPGAGPKATTPTTAPATTEENAGKVASYTNGVLTLTLGDGSSVSGKVTAGTRIECVSATPTPPTTGPGDDEGAGDDNGLGDDQGEGDRNQEGGQGDHHEGDQQSPMHAAGSSQSAGGQDNGGGGDDQGDGTQPSATEPPCDTSALIPGAVVREAELRIGPGGTEFESVELVR